MVPAKMTDMAVFSRNWPHYLAAAAKRSRDVPTTFRSKTRWVNAASAVQAHGPRPIYFASIEGDGTGEFEAYLIDVEVDPHRRARTQELLANELNLTRNEGLWNDSVQTLYVIANCRKV